MPDILIRGMEMPRSCSECFVKTCKGRGRVKHFTVERDDTCPLVELQPHGDLIDRAPLVRTFNERADHEGWAYLDDEDLDDAPVIVPASEEENT